MSNNCLFFIGLVGGLVFGIIIWQSERLLHKKKTLIISKTYTTINIFTLYFLKIKNKHIHFNISTSQKFQFLPDSLANNAIIFNLISNEKELVKINNYLPPYVEWKGTRQNEQFFSTLCGMKRNPSKLTIIFHLMLNEKEQVKINNYYHLMWNEKEPIKINNYYHLMLNEKKRIKINNFFTEISFCKCRSSGCHESGPRPPRLKGWQITWLIAEVQRKFLVIWPEIVLNREKRGRYDENTAVCLKNLSQP